MEEKEGRKRIVCKRNKAKLEKKEQAEEATRTRRELEEKRI